MKKPTILLLAYGEMGLAAYQSLKEKYRLQAIVTPPNDNGDNHQLRPVEQVAKADGIKIIKTNDNNHIEKFVSQSKPDALVICSYNKILPASLLNLTTCINVHHGDLPRMRGRANLNWAIILGKKSVGLTIHKAVPDLDAGNIYAQYEISISNSETINTLYAKVNHLVEKNLAALVKKVLAGFPGIPQSGLSTYCCTRLPNDGYIDWQKSSTEIDRFIRALTKPFPGAFTYYNHRRLTVWTAYVPSKPRTYVGRLPGRIVQIHKGRGVEVLTGNSSIILEEVTIGNKTGTADTFIKTIKSSLGIDFIVLYEKFAKEL